MEKTSLIVFLRPPQPGKVKTRLAETTTNEFALYFYKQCTKHIISEIIKVCRVNIYIFYSGEPSGLKKQPQSNFIYMPQEGKDLGMKMKNAFQKVFNDGSEKVVIIGTDIPDITHNIIEDAINRLDDNDIVIGPSKDGGYYLLGLKKMHGSLFEGIEYGISSVFTDTFSKARLLGLRHYLLTPLRDIDVENDLIQWLESSSDSLIKKDINAAYNNLN